MIIWIIYVSALALTISKGEPPVSSYLPPAAGVGGLSPQYGPPSSRPGPSQGFDGRGSDNNRLSNGNPSPQNTFGTRDIGQSNSLDNQYGPPSATGGFGQGSGRNRNGNTPSTQYGAPQSGNGFGNQRRMDSQGPSTFGREKSFDGQQRPQSSYGPPSNGQKFNDNSQGGRNSVGNSLSSTYGPPSSDNFSPNARGQQSRSPNGNFGSNGGSPNQHSTNRGNGREPESTYGPPGNSGAAMNKFNNREQFGGGNRPSSSYGVPESGSKSSDFGDSSGFDGESDEPAKYEFSYDVDDAQTGAKFGHTEQRDGGFASGEYNVLLPDGRKQVVEYEAGQQGYKPQIRYEGGGNSFGSRSQSGRLSSDGPGYPESGSSRQNENGFPGGDSNSGYPRGPAQSGQRGSNRFQDQFQQNGNQGYDSNAQSIPNANEGGFQNSGDVSGRDNQFNGGNNAGNSDGYPSGRPNQNAFSGNNLREGDPQSQGYPRGGPNGSDGSFGSGAQQGGNGYRGNESQRGRNPGNSFGGGDNEGYPSGGPSGARGSGY